MIKIITVGKLKERYLIDAVEEYKKRLNKYTKIEIIEVKDESSYEEDKNKEKEAENIIKCISDKDFIVTLEIDGKEISSVEFASKIENIFNINSNITFIIGGSYGLSNRIKELSNYKLSFSKMTFPHQLFRVILFLYFSNASFTESLLKISSTCF